MTRKPIGWRHRFICPEEGPSIWQYLPEEHVRLVEGKACYEVEPMYAKQEPLSAERLQALGIDEQTARLLEREHGIGCE